MHPYIILGVVKMKEQDLYWLAGLLEGEGYFTYSKSATISLQMTDRDIVERVSNLFGGKSIIETKARAKQNKDSYHCRIHGQAAVDLMEQLLPLMGNRRQDKIREVLARHANRTNTWSNKRKLTDDQIRLVKEMHRDGINVGTIALHLSGITNTFINRYNISDILRGITGANVE